VCSRRQFVYAVPLNAFLQAKLACVETVAADTVSASTGRPTNPAPVCALFQDSASLSSCGGAMWSG